MPPQRVIISLTEILKIYTVNALELAPTDETAFVENGDYLLEYKEGTPYSGVDDLGKYVYAYDSYGTYGKGNYLFTLLPKENVNGYGDGDNVKYIYYKYKSYQQLYEDLGGNNEAFAKKVAELTG